MTQRLEDIFPNFLQLAPQQALAHVCAIREDRQRSKVAQRSDVRKKRALEVNYLDKLIKDLTPEEHTTFLKEIGPQ